MIMLKRYPVIILSIFMLAHFLPGAYVDIFSKRKKYVDIEYSPVTEKFMKQTIPTGASRSIIYSTIDEKETFDRQGYYTYFPFKYSYSLIEWGTFPEKFSSFKDNISVIRSSKQFAGLYPFAVDYKGIELYPLLESQPKFLKLEIPEDVFRLKDRMEFIDVAKNEVNEEKTELFTKALTGKGFTFPARKIFGNPTTMKSFDAGYFIKDSNKRLFQVKMQKGQPFVAEVPTNGLDIKYIKVNEHSRREFYGLALSEDKKLYLFMEDEYEFVPLPVGEFDYINENVVLNTDPLYRHIKIKRTDAKTKTNTIRLYVTDLDYELVDKLVYTYKHSDRKYYELVRKTLFPFTLKFKKVGSHAYYPKIDNFSVHSLIFNLILVLAYIAYILKTNRRLSTHVLNALLIVAGGLYAVVAIFVFARLLYFRNDK